MTLLKIVNHLIFILVMLIAHTGTVYSQHRRLTDNNSIGRLSYTGTFKIKPNVSIHTEYQWRRVNGLKNAQQNLIRTGINYQIHPKLTVRFGYANIETYNYGGFPINAMGKQFTVHRLYQSATITDKINL
ncbi:MAG: DUF2490 domain-containing protein [Chitinophagaceae bacterium]|nr:DUF2490 domain-containing protein [Chitinophagaceae bacterium]